MNPFDFDDDGDSLSFSELPPSVARQYAQFSRALPTQPGPMPTTPPTVGPRRPINPGTPVTPIAYPIPEMPPMQPPVASQPNPVTGGGSGPVPGGFIPVPVERYRDSNQPLQPAPGQLVPVPVPEAPKDNSTLWFIGAALLLSGVGYWAYTKMEKDKRKIRVGPPGGQTASYGDDDGDTSGSDDDDSEESGSALDAYEDAGLDPADVDPHEEGGIKLVKG